MSGYRSLFCVFFIFILLDVQYADGKADEDISKHLTNKEKCSNESVTKPVEVDKQEDEEEKRKELYRRSLSEEFSKDFQLEEPTTAIKENYNSFINSIKNNREKSFGSFPIANILSIFMPGLYSLSLNYKIKEALKKVSPYRDDDHYKENQKKIDEYDRSVAIKVLLEVFLSFIHGSSAKDFSKAFQKLDRKILSDAGYEGGSTFSEMGLKLYLYECMSKLRISPQEAYAKMVEIPEDLLKRIVELLDEIEAGQDDFLRSIYNHTSTLQQYGLEDNANYEEGDRWKLETMLFTSHGSEEGKYEEHFSEKDLSGFNFKSTISTILMIALFVCCMYFISSDKYFAHMISSVILCIQSITLFFAVFVCLKDPICFASFELTIFLWFIYFVYSLFSKGEEVQLLGEKGKGIHVAALTCLIVVTLISVIVELKKDVFLGTLFNFMRCDPDTLITEALVAKHNVKISGYIKALLSLHNIIYSNKTLREIFLLEAYSFESLLIHPDDTNASESKKCVAILNYLSGKCKDVSLLDVLSDNFFNSSSNFVFARVLYRYVGTLGMLSFNAAKIRANIRLFKNEGLRAAVISALK